MHFRRCRCTGGRAAEPSFWAKNGGHGPMYSARSARPGSTRYHGGDGEGGHEVDGTAESVQLLGWGHDLIDTAVGQIVPDATEDTTTIRACRRPGLVGSYLKLDGPPVAA